MLRKFLELHRNQCGYKRVGESADRLDLGYEREKTRGYQSRDNLNNGRKKLSLNPVVNNCRRKNSGGKSEVHIFTCEM